VSSANVVNANFKDITIGRCGYYMGLASAAGWDQCTGIGDPLGWAGK
jgi:hypothetical protein